MEQANLFELHSTTLKITYSASSFSGQPQLSYQKGTTSLNFSGKQLHQEQTAIGTLITVTLDATPDSRSFVLSLLVPRVNVSDNAPSAKVNIKAIETTIRTSIGGPDLVKGQVQNYKVYSLRGTAKKVAF